MPASPPTGAAADTATASNQPADSQGYEPQLHPDQLPASVPGQGSLLHQLTGKKPSKTPKKRMKTAPDAKKTSTTDTSPDPTPKVKPDNLKNTQQSKKKEANQKANQKAKQSTGATPDTASFGVEICTFEVPALRMVNIVTSPDYATLRHTAFLNDVIIDFANSWLFNSAEPNVGDTVHIFPTSFYVALAALHRPRKGSDGEARELAEGLPLPERRHGRVASRTRHVQLYDKEIILFPISLDTRRPDAEKHWLLLAVLLGQDPVVVVMDSLGGDRQDQLTEFREFMEVEARVKGKEVPKFREIRAQVPQQQDGFNCGTFVIMYVARILADPAGFAARVRQDQLGDWFLPSAVSGQRSHWAEVLRDLSTSQAPRQARRFLNIQFEPPNALINFGCMLNLERCCFVVTAFLLLCWCDVATNLLPTEAQSLAQQNLSTTFTTMATQRRDHRVGPMSPEPFVLAVNTLGQRQFLYTVQMEDTCELMETVLDNLPLRPGFMVTLREEGTCQTCSNFTEQVRMVALLLT